MTQLLVIRHAATDWNEAGRIQGRADRPLSLSGRQALERQRLPLEWRRASCIASPLARAIETACRLGLDPEPDLRLIEMDWGEWEGRTLAELRGELGQSMTANEARGLDFRPPGGESPRDVQTRLRPLFDDLRAPTVAVTHKGVLRALYALATGWTMQADAPDKLLADQAHLFAVVRGAPSVEELNIPLEPRP